MIGVDDIFYIIEVRYKGVLFSYRRFTSKEKALEYIETYKCSPETYELYEARRVEV